MLMVDGSSLEGGGQIVRSAVALSAVTGIPVEITRIRENRKQPGLRYQHCAAVRAVASSCTGHTEGNEPGSSRLSFFPMDIRRTESSVAVGTAGSIPLVIQAWLPVALVKGGLLEVTGGTEVPASPTIDYLEKVMIPALGAQGKGISITVIRRGYYPSGGGIVQIKVKTADHERISITKEISCGIRSCSSGLPPHVAERQASSAKMLLDKELLRSIPADIRRSRGVSKGSSCTVWYGARGASALGRPGLPAERVGEAAATDLIREIRSPGEVDPHLSDQLLLYLAQFGGSFTAPEYTLHARTMCWLLSLFGLKIHVREGEEVEFSA